MNSVDFHLKFFFLQEECADKEAKIEVSINGKYECSERLPNTLNFSFIGEGLTGSLVYILLTVYVL